MILKSIKSFKYAFRGIWLVFKNENNAKIHLMATLSAIAGGIYFEITIDEWLWVSLAMALVWIMETLNSALEKLVDLASPAFHPMAGAVKDMAAGAVLIAAIFAVVVGVAVFGPYLTH
ncbi:MAG TPA: diacylglycerol kinase family protein [Cytophagaceae bacterium]